MQKILIIEGEFPKIKIKITTEFIELMASIADAHTEQFDIFKKIAEDIYECVDSIRQDYISKQNKIHYNRFYGIKKNRVYATRKDIKHNNAIINGIHSKNYRCNIRRNLKWVENL